MPPCQNCRYHRPETINGHTFPCTLQVRALEERCPYFIPMPPLELCQKCGFARFQRPGEPPLCFAYAHNYSATSCPHFKQRQPFPALPCPECGRPLSVEEGEACCSAGHRWKLRQSQAVCPRCGRHYYTFGIDEGHQRIVFKVCPAPGCRWNSKTYRRRPDAAPEARGYGGQRWSPQTGRVLAKH